MIKSEYSNMKCLCTELQRCLQGKGPTPSYEIELCFGEEYPDPNAPKTSKLIMAQVGGKGSSSLLVVDKMSYFYFFLILYMHSKLGIQFRNVLL